MPNLAALDIPLTSVETDPALVDAARFAAVVTLCVDATSLSAVVKLDSVVVIWYVAVVPVCVDAASLLAVVKLDSEVVDRYVAVMPGCVDAVSLLTVVRSDSVVVAW